MANDGFRQLARAVLGRLRGVLSQTVRNEVERAARYLRERMASRAGAPRGLTVPHAPVPPADGALREAPTGEAPPGAPAAEAPAPAPLPKPASTPAWVAPKRMSEDAPRTSKPDGEASAAAAKPAAAEGPLDVNAASRDELIALPGIGEARADAIIKTRPFKAVAELRDRKILPASVFEALKDRIIVG